MDAHSIKHYKNKKKVVKSEINNGAAEVYVLPPDLLKKLGINLGSVNSDVQVPLDGSPKRELLQHEQIKPQSIYLRDTDKTISETASLLKEAILITGSPTLTPTVSRIAGELEISNETEEVNNVNKIPSCNGSGESQINAKLHHIDILASDSLIEHHTHNTSHGKLSTYNVEEKVSCKNSTDVVKQPIVREYCLEDKDENKNYYEIADENKKILKNKIRDMVKNKNKFAAIKHTNVKCEHVIKPTINCNQNNTEHVTGSEDLINIPNPSVTAKINIISEEIVDSSKLNELKKKHSSKLPELKPVTITTVINAKKTDDSKNIQPQQNTFLEIETDSDEINDFKDSLIVIPITENEINGNNIKEEKIFCEIKNECNSFVIDIKNDDNISLSNVEHSSDNEEYVLERNSIKLINSDDKCGLNEGLDETDFAIKFNEIKFLNPSKLSNEENNLDDLKQTDCNNQAEIGINIPNEEQNVITGKSKLSVQGVEKPGGENNEKINENIPKIIKTYQKRKKIIKPTIHNQKEEIITILSGRNIDTTEIDAVAPSEDYKYEFCVCDDFCIFNLYKKKTEYEHMPYIKRNNISVDPELVYSIYDDENSKRYPNMSYFATSIDSEEETDENTHFCWGKYTSEESVSMKNKVNYSRNKSHDSGSGYHNDQSKKVIKENPAPDESSASLTSKSRNFSSVEKVISGAGKGPISQKKSSELPIKEGSPEPKVTKLDNNNKKVFGRKSKNSISLSSDEYKKAESNEELPIVEITKVSPSEAQVKTVADVEIAPPKRKRGRPRKVVPVVTEDCKADETVQIKQTSSNSTVIDRNNIIEQTPGSKRTRRSNANYLDDLNDDDRSSRCSRRADRSRSSTSLCDGNTHTVDVDDDSEVQCGVCKETIKNKLWMEHIGKEHDYLAWKEGSKPPELNDEIEVKNYLQGLLNDIDVLICYKCGVKRKYVASYLKHRRLCEDGEANISQDSTINESNTSLDCSKLIFSLKDSQEPVICGVCKQEVKGCDWIRHTQMEHNYVAWADGETPLDVNDPLDVQKHLQTLAKKIGGLTCHKCGLVRKYANIYLQHVKTCDAEGFTLDDGTLSGDKVQCAVCSEEVAPKDWKHHAMSKHYNIAWKVGAPPIDMKNYYVVESYLKEYKNKFNKLVCKICRDSKVSCCGFYAHVIQCGKSEEEIDEYRETCDICNKQYLCMYRSQHMTWHREKENALERKKLAELKTQEQDQDDSNETPGRRKAAERARTVIAKYKEELKEKSQKEEEFNTGYSSDSDVSVKMEQFTDEESEDIDESEISDETESDVEKKRKRTTDTNAPTITRIPYHIKDVRSYIAKSFEDLCTNHLTSNKLYPEWSDCEYEKVSEDEIDKYMPPIKVSCKVKVVFEGWKTYERFQATNTRDCVTLFVGASIQCVSWAPVPLDDANGYARNFLAIACHSGKDSPRYDCNEAPEHSNLLQIWDFGDIQTSTPKFALGIAHDYGTIWAMDWCPSGARDFINDGNDSKSQKRLGLLAIACSNGRVYILSIPYPSQITEDDEVFYKLKPVAELRLSSVEKYIKYQASALRWSLQKGHNIIMVGYSNGMTAFYDLTNDSPLLIGEEDGVKIIYPFNDERSHNSCVTGVDVFAGGLGWSGGAAVSASGSGARARAGGQARGAALLSALACAGAFFLPHWPSAVLTAVNSKVNQTVNELEWQASPGARSGRRVGGVRVHAACGRCGALAAADAPLLSVLHAHPAHPPHRTRHAHHDIAKHVAATLQMTSLAQKRKQTNDELAMKLEPLTYDDAVLKYGIEFHTVPRKSNTLQQKALSMPMIHYPERFPLAEVTSMSFCPSAAHHNKLAVATHGGILFLVNVV